MVKIYSLTPLPDFISLQHQSLKHIEDNYEHVILNNGKGGHRSEIRSACGSLGIECIEVPQNDHVSPWMASGIPLQWAWENVISQTDDKFCIIDSDMFFVRNFSFIYELHEIDLIFLSQSREEVYYIWNGLVMGDMSRLPEKESVNWMYGEIDGQQVDVGGMTCHYLRAHKDLRIRYLSSEVIRRDDAQPFRPPNYEWLELRGRKIVLHYRGGSNWDKKEAEYHRLKKQWLKETLLSLGVIS